MSKRVFHQRLVGDVVVSYRFNINKLPAQYRRIATIVCIGLFSLLPNTPSAQSADATGLVTSAARRHGVPASFALRVARVESGIRCGLRNGSGASGPLQIMPASARALGYRGYIGRASCAVQTEYGMRHLAMCYRGAHANQRVAAACHYQGVSALHRVSRAGASYALKVKR